MNERDNIKAEFRKFIQCIFPEKIANRRQVRDLIRTFVAGWITCLHHGSNKRKDAERAIEILSQTEFMRNPNWWPDESWSWW